MRTNQPKTPAARSDLTIPTYAVAGVLIVIYLTMQLGSLLGTGRFAADVITPGWTGWDTIAAVIVAIVCVAAGVFAVRLLLRRKTSAEHVDSKAPSMGSPVVLSKDNAERKAIEGRMHRADQDPGLMLGRSVVKDQELWSNWRDGIVVEMGPGAGKALSLDTAIPTPTGWATMESLRVGDEVFDEHGIPTTVVAATDVMHDRPCYELTFSCGEKVVADADHLWATRTRLDRKVDGHIRSQRVIAGTHADYAAAERVGSLDQDELITRGRFAKDMGWRAGGGRVYQWMTNLPAGKSPRGAFLTIARHRMGRTAGWQTTKNPLHRPGGLVTTKEIAETLIYTQHQNHTVQVCEPVQYPKRDLPIQPYTLGAWLGDGSSAISVITNHPRDAQILDEIRGDGYDVRGMKHPWSHHIGNGSERTRRVDLIRSAIESGSFRNAAARHYGLSPSSVCGKTRIHVPPPMRRGPTVCRIDGYDQPAKSMHLCTKHYQSHHSAGVPHFPVPSGPPLPPYRLVTQQLRDIGVLGNKHIPSDYLTASVEQRLALLQGLMDTDGTVGRTNSRCTFAVTSEQLAQGFLELVLSLGIRAGLHESLAKIDGRVIGPQYKITFRPSLPVFRLHRKRDRLVPLGAKWNERTKVRYIKDAQPVASVPVRCIRVANPSGLFLASRSFIPTHNSTAIAVPMVINAPGVVVATSNKRDLADAVKLTCEKRGTCWVFDPQRIANYRRKSGRENYHAGDVPDWWWNPLEDIKGPVEAAALAKVFADASAPTGASKNAYFDTAGPQLLAHLILAAAVDGKQLDQVYLWIADPNAAQREAVKVLRDHVFPLPAAALKGACNAAPEEKSGLFGTAAAAVSFLTAPAILEWVTDTAGRPQFVPEKFVNSAADTLISLSREGVGTAGPLTTALTVAVMTAAERNAQQHPHGRLLVPIVCVLDEVANVCRWQGLPAQFSHYGSAGICLVAILQNWSQGVTTWRREGMQQLWDAATIRVVGAGIADRSHLADIAQLIDQRWMPRRTAGSNHGDKTSRSVNDSFERELIMSVGDIAGLPAGRMIVIPSGGYPILAKTVPWFARPEMVEQVAESIRWNEPA